MQTIYVVITREEPGTYGIFDNITKAKECANKLRDECHYKEIYVEEWSSIFGSWQFSNSYTHYQINRDF